MNSQLETHEVHLNDIKVDFDSAESPTIVLFDFENRQIDIKDRIYDIKPVIESNKRLLRGFNSFSLASTILSAISIHDKENPGEKFMLTKIKGIRQNRDLYEYTTPRSAGMFILNHAFGPKGEGILRRISLKYYDLSHRITVCSKIPETYPHKIKVAPHLSKYRDLL